MWISTVELRQQLFANARMTRMPAFILHKIERHTFTFCIIFNRVNYRQNVTKSSSCSIHSFPSDNTFMNYFLRQFVFAGYRQCPVRLQLLNATSVSITLSNTRNAGQYPLSSNKSGSSLQSQQPFKTNDPLWREINYFDWKIFFFLKKFRFFFIRILFSAQISLCVFFTRFIAVIYVENKATEKWLTSLQHCLASSGFVWSAKQKKRKLGDTKAAQQIIYSCAISVRNQGQFEAKLIGH